MFSKSKILILIIFVFIIIQPLNKVNGIETWRAVYKTDFNDEATIKKIQEDSNGNLYLMVKNKNVIKTNSSGNFLWKWETPFSLADGISSVIYSAAVTTDNGLILSGDYKDRNDPGNYSILLKINKKGNAEWKSLWGEGYSGCFSSIELTSDHGFIVSGREGSFSNGVILKVDQNGEYEWSRIIKEKATFTIVRQVSDESYMVYGDKNLIKISKGGIIEWEKKLNKRYESMSVSSEGFVFLTSRNSVLKLDRDGIEKWNKEFPKTNLWTIEALEDGGCIVGGGYQDSSHAYAIKLDENGNIKWSNIYQGNGSRSAFICSEKTSDGGIILGGWSYQAIEKFNYFLVKINSEGETGKLRVY